MLSVNMSDIVIVTIKNVYIIHSISKSEASNLLKNSVHEDVGIYKKYYLNF